MQTTKMPEKLQLQEKITYSFLACMSEKTRTSINCKSSELTIFTRKRLLSCCLMVIILLSVPDFIAGLKDVSVTIPQAVKRGSNALLICNYDMENDTLYSVKWYKGRREFYRYTPKENPAMKVFPMAAGLNVERNLSNQSHVVLLAVPLNISGKFTCEISVEAPTFQTAMVSGELEVVELPEEQAIVTGIQPRYRIGDLVDGNCSIKYSKPAANLTWTINGIVVPLHHIKTYQIERYEENNLESVVSALHFMVTTQHFIKGQMRLKCTASIFDIFKEEIESVIEEDRPRIMASGRSYDMHNNYPYEQHSSGDGFEDHNESFLTYSAADISSSATTIHPHINMKFLNMHWKHIWIGVMASMASFRAFNNQWKQNQPALAQKHRSVKWISEVSYDDEREGKAAAATPTQIFSIRKSVAYIFALIFTTYVFLRSLVRHFISCQRMHQKSTLLKREGRAMPTQGETTTNSMQYITNNVLISKVIRATTSATAKSTISMAIVKRTSNERKSFHNCIGKNLKVLNVRLVRLLRILLLMVLMVIVRGVAIVVNPLKKLQILIQQKQIYERQKEQQQQKSTAKLRNEAHLQHQHNAIEQLAMTVAVECTAPPLQTTLDALTFDTAGVCAGAIMHRGVLWSPTINTTNTCNSKRSSSSSSSSSGKSGSNNQAIANFAKDTSKDQTLLMMIAQGFVCQHVDDFVTVSPYDRCTGVGKRQQWCKVALQIIKNDKAKKREKAKALAINWEENCSYRSFC